MSAPDSVEVASLYTEGVESVVEITDGFTPEQWESIVCGAWSATETARHLASVADWYHLWLDRAMAGERTAPFPAEEIDAMTAESLDRYQHLDGLSATMQFGERASSYLDRVIEHWDAPYSFPFGHVTAGLHAGVAAAEWHLHAWDLSAATAARHEPADPELLFLAAGSCVSAAEGGAKGWALGLAVPLAARRQPWIRMLRRSGRVE